MTEDLLKMFPENTILAGYIGSISHNTFIPHNVPNSLDDVDLMGVFMPPAKSYLGLAGPKEVVTKFIDEYDIVCYEFKKMVRMLAKFNPNAICMLWLKDDHYLKKTVYGNALLNNRDLFSSKRAYSAYVGYAHGQLIGTNKSQFNGYMGSKRKALVEKFGYDTKMASHSIRLLRMGTEFLDTGILNVYREQDAEELVAIKTGKWTLEEVKAEADRLFEAANASVNKSFLPDEPDVEAINKLVEEVVYNYISNDHEVNK